MDDLPEGKKGGQRSQRRTESAVPVQIRGIDGDGAEFEDSTEAIEVSRRGLSLLTKRNLPLFTALTVVLPGRGPRRPGEGATDFFSSATVVRVIREGDVYRVGIRFIGATLTTYTAESG
ncbi:MAG TPA: PilZ domain-containing protein [Terriglobia bacterium]|nr:PilZ domain-containing protein [Terriglobia bacterium]